MDIIVEKEDDEEGSSSSSKSNQELDINPPEDLNLSRVEINSVEYDVTQ